VLLNGSLNKLQTNECDRVYVIGSGRMRVIGTRSGIGNNSDASLAYITYTTIVEINCDDKECMDLFHDVFQFVASLLAILGLWDPLHE
jgi:hypothetical protein